MNECLDVPCIIRLLKDCDRPLEVSALMDDAACAIRRMEIAIRAFLKQHKAACEEGKTMRLDELAKLMREALE